MGELFPCVEGGFKETIMADFFRQSGSSLRGGAAYCRKRGKKPEKTGNGRTVTLETDGTGYLDWGDDNKGPIDWWTMDGEALQFKAGVTIVDGTINNGIMILEMDDGFYAYFTLPDADTSDISPISVDAYYELLYGIEADEA